jgi:hypothetical protein
VSQARLSPLLRLGPVPAKSELEISSLTHDLPSRRPWTPADGDPSLNNSAPLCAKLALARKARSGPGRRQAHSPTTATPEPSPGPTDLSGKRCPPRRTSVSRSWGKTSPLFPQTPFYPLSVPKGRQSELVAEAARPAPKTDRRVAQNLTTERRLMTPKPAKPDHRVWRRSPAKRRTITQKMTT